MSMVVAFNRDRDSYQVALALAEIGQLECLITDHYQGSLPFYKIPGMAHRQVPGILPSQVHGNIHAFCRQVLWSRRGGAFPHRKVAADLSRAAAKRARRSGADLLLYSTFAEEAFYDERLACARKGLFVFHPHPAIIQDLLAADIELYPEARESYAREPEVSRSAAEALRLDRELSRSDYVIVASTFTESSIRNSPGVHAPVTVAPYGCPPPRYCVKEPGPTRFLFVGQGVQRKGLHHLLTAWSESGLAKEAVLDCIVTSADQGILRMASDDVRIRGRVPRNELQEAYRSAHVLVLPSLVEGFGLVLPEALASGCRLIGTDNTGLADLGLARDLSSIVGPGDIAQLLGTLREAHEAVQTREPVEVARKAYEACATRSWDAFRTRIQEAVLNGST